MANELEFVSISLSREKYFSWVFLVNWILTCILCLTMCFYLGRIFAYSVSFFLDWFLWRRFNVKVTIGSLRLSLLSARISFKNLLIVTENSTISVLEGRIVWQYWILNSRISEYELHKIGKEQDELHDDIQSGSEALKNVQLPCKFLLQCEGFEIFVYNRTTAYDNIINAFSKEERTQYEEFLEEHYKFSRADSIINLPDTIDTNHNSKTETVVNEEELNDTDKESIYVNEIDNTSRFIKRLHATYEEFKLNFYPIALGLSRGSIIIGNKFTPSILILNFSSAKGISDASPATHPQLDLFKIKLRLDIDDFEIQLKPNVSYEDTSKPRAFYKDEMIFRIWQKFSTILEIIPNPIINKFKMLISHHKHKKSQEEDMVDSDFSNKWKGLSLYKQMISNRANSDEDIEFDFQKHEYAKIYTIAKATRLVFCDEFDVPGITPFPEDFEERTAINTSTTDSTSFSKYYRDIDTDNEIYPAPEMSKVIRTFDASICFGPWAQRQIDIIQKVFSPTLSRTTKISKKKKPGSVREIEESKIKIIFMDDSSWRIPIRESSKDQEFMKKFLKTKDEFRAFGWIDLDVSKNSEVDVLIRYHPDESGFSNKLLLNLNDLEIRTSVNHDILLKTQAFKMDADIGYPLGWNDTVEWTFKLYSYQIESFYLHEHSSLIVDMLKDFGSGIPTPYEHFRPSIYHLEWDIEGYSTYLNINDHNIINNPLDFNENCYLSIHGEHSKFSLSVPHTSITNAYYELKFNLFSPYFRLRLDTPSWSTLNEFMRNKDVGCGYDFNAEGIYTMYSELDIDNVDALTLDCTTKHMSLMLYGFIVKSFLNVQENYFGDFSKFITAEEYTQLVNKKKSYNSDDEEEYSNYTSDITSNNINSHLSDELSEDETIRLDKEVLNDPPLKRNDIKRKSNETDIWFTFSVWDGSLLLPEMLYNGDPCIVLSYKELVHDFRNTNYYFEASLTVNAATLLRYVGVSENDIFKFVHTREIDTHLKHGTLDSLTLHGHRMYGIPPQKDPYFSTWDIDFSGLNVHSDITFTRGLILYGSKVGYEFKNLENTLIYNKVKLNNMASLKITGNDITLTVLGPDPTLYTELKIKSLLFEIIDFLNDEYSTRTDAKISDLTVTVFKNSSENTRSTLFKFDTGFHFTKFFQARDTQLQRELQQIFIAFNDSPFHRCFFLLKPHVQQSLLYQELYGDITPSSSIPPLPLPIRSETVDFIKNDMLGFYWKKNKQIFAVEKNRSIALPPKISLPESEMLIFEPQFEKKYHQTQADVTTSNYIIDVNHISIDVDPAFFYFIPMILDSFYPEDIVATIDVIEMGIVDSLGAGDKDLDQMSNMKIQLKTLNFFFGQRLKEGLELSLTNFDLEISQKSFEREQPASVDEFIILIKLFSLRANIFQIKSSTDIHDGYTPSLSFSIQNCVCWSSTSYNQVNSLNFASTDLTIDEDQAEWLLNYILQQSDNISSLVKSIDLIQKKNNNVQKQLLSDLTRASEYYQINHDPYVITKPSFVMRVSRGHVRQNRSWRIVTRLRHIYTYLPSDWKKSIHKMKNDKSVNDINSTDNIFLSVFSNWRNWEVSDVARSYIYKKIFLADDEIIAAKNLPRTLKLTFDSIFLTVYNNSFAVDHTVSLTKADVIIETSPREVVLDNSSDNKSTTLFNISGSIDSLKGEISDSIIDLLALLPQFSKQKKDNTEPENITITKEYRSLFSFNAFFLLKHCSLKLRLGTLTVSTEIINGKLSSLVQRKSIEENFAYSLVYYMDKTSIYVSHLIDNLAEFQLHNFILTSTGLYKSDEMINLVGLRSSDLHLKALISTARLVLAIEDIQEYFSKLHNEYMSNKPKNKVVASKKDSKNIEFNFIVSCNLSNLNADITLLSPFFIKYETKQLDIYYNREENKDILINFWNSDIFVTSHKTGQQYFRLSCDDIQATCSTLSPVDIPLDISISTSLLKLTLSEPRKVFMSFLEDEKIAVSSYKELQKVKEVFSSIKPKSAESKESLVISKVKHETKWSLELNVNYLGILVPIASTFFVLELHMLLGSLTNKNSDVSNFGNEVSGQISLENILFLINDRHLPLRLSKLVDFSIRVSTLQKNVSAQQSFQVESSHFRVCLSPLSLVYLIWGITELNDEYEHFSEKRPNIDWGFKSKKPSTNILPLSKFGSIHILSYNFCVGWILPKNEFGIPGWMIGYDRLFSAYEQNYGKLTLIEGYFTITNSNSSSDFFSLGNEKYRHNRSYLPSMQILFWLKESVSKKKLFIRFHGDALDVDLLSNFVTIIELTFQSYKEFETFRNMKISQHSSKRKPHHNSDTTSQLRSRFLSNIDSVNCEFNYEGGKLRVYSFDDIEIDSIPSLELNAPKVTMFFHYDYRENETKPHLIRSMLHISSTHNVLYSRCASFIIDFFESIQEIIQTKSDDNNLEAPKVVTPSERNYKKLLVPFDIACKIEADQQMLSFSCEPSAKVRADVGVDSFIFGIATNNADNENTLNVSLSINTISASVQHIFSKEASASFVLNFIDITFMFTQHTLYCVSLISDVDVFFNIKQQQNLLLFLDIWKISETVGLRPKRQKSKKKKKKSTSVDSQISKEEEKTTMPWSVNIAFTNINGDIHLGPALGVVSAKLDSAWFTSDRYTDKHQVLKIFANNLTFSSKGRLSGIFEISKIGWSLDVKYPENEQLHNAPLIQLGIDIDAIQVKTAFDFHMFMIANLDKLEFRLRSERDESGKLSDLLVIVLFCENINICSTALVASNLLDIYNTILRTKQDTKMSYYETLLESNTAATKSSVQYSDILESLNLLRTDSSIEITTFNIQISPISLFDFEVLVVHLENVSLRSETRSAEKLETRLELQLSNARVSLSTSNEELNEAAINEITVEDYMKYASKLRGGTILVIPKLLVGITTWQKAITTTIEYLFTCKFEDKISVRWNLGPVNFIKEMWATHVQSLAVRQSTSETLLHDWEKEAPEPVNIEPPKPKFIYIAREEPLIEMPQIKDLEGATPPMEWFGVNRKRFPGFTHKTAVIPVQKIVHLAEQEYAKLVGSANK